MESVQPGRSQRCNNSRSHRPTRPYRVTGQHVMSLDEYPGHVIRSNLSAKSPIRFVPTFRS